MHIHIHAYIYIYDNNTHINRDTNDNDMEAITHHEPHCTYVCNCMIVTPHGCLH